jgi:signal peptide peptidase SppA
MSLHRFLDTPLALTERRAASMIHDLRKHVMHPYNEHDLEPVMRALVDENAVNAVSVKYVDDNVNTYSVISGVAVIPISGVLVHGNTSLWDETDYGSISTQFDGAMDNPEVRGIALQIASPGGEVSGLFELAETIYDKKTEKPVWAILDDHAYSAAYALASAADKVTIPRAGGVGSIGVLTIHLDLTKLLETTGVKVSLIQYGERKTDYSPFRPLSDVAKTRLQADVDTIGEMFVEMVGRNRRLSRAKVRATEAGIFMGNQGVEQGFADAIMSPQQAFAALVAKVN